MRKSIQLAMLLPLLLTVSYAGECSFFGPGESFGYSSDEVGTGSYLGVDISDVTSDRVSALKLKDEHGVEVTMVDQDAPAGKAGLKEHDVIMTMNGTTVDSGAQLRRMIRETPPGRIITLGLSRDGQPLTVKVQLADRRKEFASNGKGFKFEMPAMPSMPPMPDFPTVVVVHSSARSGLMVENITSQLGEFFGVKDGKGVLVRSVDKDSRAAKAGFRAGDVIVRVNGLQVHDTSDFTHALRSRNTTAVNVGIIRDKKEQTLTLSLPEHKDTGSIFEETLEVPEIDADALNLSELHSEIARVRPQMEMAIQQSRRELENIQPQIEQAHKKATEQARKELCVHRQELQEQQKALREHAREMRKQVEDQQRELRRQQRKWQQQLRHELRGEWTEI